MISVLDVCMMIAGLILFSIPIVQWAMAVLREESSKYHSWKWFRPHLSAKMR